MSSPAGDIADFMRQENVDSSPWAVYVGYEPDAGQTVNNEAITCYDSPGAAPNPKFGWDEPGVQIRVRGGRHDYVGARAKADSIKDLLLGRNETMINGSAYTLWRMLGEPNFLGYDENERPLFTLNFFLGRRPATLGNRASL